MWRITTKFGVKDSWHKNPHSGIDLAIPKNFPLKAVDDGVIHKVVDYGSKNIGKGIMIRTSDGKILIYGHLNKYGEYNVGDTVKVGDTIGYCGTTGHSSGYHLHFGVKQNGHFIDPQEYLDRLQNMDNVDHLKKLCKVKEKWHFSYDDVETPSHTTDSLTIKFILQEWLEALKDIIDLFI